MTVHFTSKIRRITGSLLNGLHLTVVTTRRDKGGLS